MTCADPTANTTATPTMFASELSGSTTAPAISGTLISDLFLKQLFESGSCTLRDLAGYLKLPGMMIDSLFHRMKKQLLIEVTGMHGDDFVFCLSGAGRKLALERLQISRYVGPAPVSLDEYQKTVRAQAGSDGVVDPVTLKAAYADLTLEQVGELGPAIISGTSMLLYGPSGTGKSALAERILRVFGDVIAVPYAVEVHGAIISVFDPSIHHPLGDGFNEADPRWVLCTRPCVIVGGELVPSMLELQKDTDTGTYSAPLHMKANNGVFVVDDFGRQQISPRDLSIDGSFRWIEESTTFQ